MFHKFNRTAIVSLSVVAISIIVGLGVNIVLAAWTAPSSTPPAGDIAAPINISDADQYKLGGLRLGSAASPGAYQLYVEGDTFSQGNIVPDTAGNYSLGKGTYDSWSNSTWNQLWLKSDVGSTFINGIHFDNPVNNVGITFDRISHTFNFIKGEAGASTIVGSISHLGDFWAKNKITGVGGMDIDTNTLTVDATNNRVGIGTATPTYALDVDNGDASIARGRMIIGSDTIPDANATLYVGTSAAPVTTIRAIEAYSNGAESTIYGVNSGSSWRAGVEGDGLAGTYGVRGVTSSSSRAGTAGFNTGYSINSTDYFAPGLKGKSAVIFGTSIFNHVQSAGVLGESGDTNLSRGYVSTYGVYAKAGTASADSPIEHINTYGLYATEGAEINGGVSYAGYFSGDVHVTGDLTTTFGSNVGIGTTSLTDALRVRGSLRVDNEDANPAYLQIDSITTAPVASDCDIADEVGRMVLDATGNKLYVCDDTGWKSVSI
ncbi:MAG: hypothetical protein WC693_01555 [Patescibacteria group bacterium]